MYEDLRRDIEQLRSSMDGADALLGKFIATYARHQVDLLNAANLDSERLNKVMDAPSLVRGEFIAAKTKVDMLLGVIETFVNQASGGPADPAPA